jgi:hypothetical protein
LHIEKHNILNISSRVNKMYCDAPKIIKLIRIVNFKFYIQHFISVCLSVFCSSISVSVYLSLFVSLSSFLFLCFSLLLSLSLSLSLSLPPFLSTSLHKNLLEGCNKRIEDDMKDLQGPICLSFQTSSP